MRRFSASYLFCCLEASKRIKEMRKKPMIGDFFFLPRENVLVCNIEYDGPDAFYGMSHDGIDMTGKSYLVTSETEKAWVPDVSQLMMYLVEHDNDYNNIAEVLALYDPEQHMGLDTTLLMLIAYRCGYVWNKDKNTFIRNKEEHEMISFIDKIYKNIDNIKDIDRVIRDN